MNSTNYKYFKTALGEAKKAASSGTSFNESLRQVYRSRLEEDLKSKASQAAAMRPQLQRQSVLADLLTRMNRPN